MAQLKGGKFLKSVLQQAPVQAIQEAGAWLADRMVELVGKQTGPRGPGSPEDTAPYRRTGAGQETIGFQRIPNGVRVGVEPIKRFREKKPPSMDKMPGRNYLFGHDQGVGVSGGKRRPWLSQFYDRYQDEFARMVLRSMADKMKVVR